ncbi:hypothetical protein [Candidatus Odyssella thessalonicensis]|uniref:hypothetical protein n=1 Tax=Candidatus Odyssella thessalonicensis TaxID=84647 RepID=UPI00031F8783|nr:hypothetical protein [Candidatus Odyssella thessalonicensis]
MYKHFLLSASYFLLSLPLQAMEKDDSSNSPSKEITSSISSSQVINREPLMVETMVPSQFRTGKDLWEQSKEVFKSNVLDQTPPMQEWFRGLLRTYGSLEEMASKRLLCVPVQFINEKAIPGLSLEFIIQPDNFAPYQLLHAFNEAIFHIRDLMVQLHDKALYVRRDLETLSKIMRDILCFFKQAETLAKDCFGVDCAPYDRTKVLEELLTPHYTSASLITSEINKYSDYVIQYHDSKIGIYEYINFYSRLYYILFQNHLCLIHAHLDESKNKTTIKLLNRPLPKGTLTQEYNLIHNSLPSLDRLRQFEPSTSVAEATTQRQKSKRERRKRKKHLFEQRKALAISSVAQTAEQSSAEIPPSMFEVNLSPSAIIEPEPLASNLKNERIDPLQPEKMADEAALVSPLPITEKVGEAGQASAANAELEEEEEEEEEANEVVARKAEAEEAPAVREKEETADAFAIKEVAFKNTAQSKPSLPRPNATPREVQKLITLEKVLAEHDGGAYAGMPTRQFLSLAQALNKLGYFKSFSANKKEVIVNTHPLAAQPTGCKGVFHTGHVSGKNKGLSQKTAKTFNDLIKRFNPDGSKDKDKL